MRHRVSRDLAERNYDNVILVGQGATVTDTWPMSSYEWESIRTAGVELLRARGDNLAAETLDSFEFELLEGTNVFRDEFYVLALSVPVPRYVQIEQLHRTEPRLFSAIAGVVTEVGPFVRFVTLEVAKVQDVPGVPRPSPTITSATVARALDDAEQLLRSQGPVSAFDRVHTAVHGYLKEALKRSGVPTPEDASLPALFKLLQSKHPKLAGAGAHAEHVRHLLRSAGSIIDTLNTLRNRASAAHPNENLLDEAEAALAINLGRTLLHYLDAKIGRI